MLDDTYQRFVVSPPSDIVLIKVNFTDNPFFPRNLAIRNGRLQGERL
ncbi:hypothetical protein [Avibacterium paragallinarum]